MKQFILVDATFDSSSLIETLIDDKILKEYAYGMKYKSPRLEYGNILIPLILMDESDHEFSMNYYKLAQKVVQKQGITYSEDVYYSLYKTFSEIINKDVNCSLNVIDLVDEDNIGIFYTDGSFSKNTEEAAYACCQLLDESNDGLADDFTGRKFEFNAYSGKIEKGTNNIGELTAIKVAIENFHGKKYQMIISDSIYGIKSYREYIHTWKNNGYKAYNKKPIKNKELICETYAKLQEKQNDHIVLLKWTKGHANNSFNEKCDEMAKKELGI